METFDWQRMWLGDLSWGFALEIVLRTTIMYVYTFGMVRLTGKRSSQQLTPFEFLMVIALGTAVGDPMLYPEVPLVAALLAITVIVGLEKLLALAGQFSARIEVAVEGVPHTVVLDGRLDLAGMEQESLASEELFGELRRAGIEQLGQIKYACVEQSGIISVFKYPTDEAHPGLPIVPPWDIAAPPSYAVSTVNARAGLYVCRRCGARMSLDAGDIFARCPACNHEQWSEAVMEVELARLLEHNNKQGSK